MGLHTTGWVYVIVNDSIPNKVKVGVTKNHPRLRASEMNKVSAPLPTPYYAATAFLFGDKAYRVEQDTHRLLKKKGVHIEGGAGQEWFECSTLDAAYAIREASTLLNESILKEDPVLLTPEEIAARDRQEAERKRLEKQKEEAQRQQRKAEEEGRLRKQEQERQARLRETEEQKRLRSEHRGKLVSNIGCGLVVIIFVSAGISALVKTCGAGDRRKRLEALNKEYEKKAVENQRNELQEMISLHEKRSKGTITRQEWDRLIDIRRSMEYKLKATEYGIPYVTYRGSKVKTRKTGMRKLTDKEQAERDEISAALKRVTVPPYTSVDFEISYEHYRAMRGRY